MQQNDRLRCRIVNYIPRERKFEVEDVNSNLKGFVVFHTNYQDISILKEAINTRQVITLYFDRLEGDHALFSYRALKPQAVREKKVEIKALFSGKDGEYNLSLFDALYSAIGSVIDSEEKYCLAKQLLVANKELRVRAGLAKDFFKISTTTFQQRFWEEGKDAPIGNYKVKVVLYNKRSDAASIPFQVTVYPTLGETKVFPGFVKTEMRNIDVVEFEYTELGIRYK